MKRLGLTIKKGELWYSVLEGDCCENAEILKTEKNNFQAETGFPELMNYFHRLFSEIITEYQPNSVAIRLSLDAKLGQIPYLHCPIGVLGCLCREIQLPLTIRSSKWTDSKKREECRAKFSPVKLNDNELYATVVALHEFEVKDES